MGQHAWLLFATIVTELLIIVKWSRGQFPAPFPRHIKLGAVVASGLLVGYPLFKFGIPKVRRYLRRKGRVERKPVSKVE
ncbi:hypothetical protein FRC02_006560 [Tulasnella sp. 418]|nr:hypothetical protein FRC02_006560 [Tulasnella sp. 418]